MANRKWSDAEIGEQTKRVEASQSNRVFYERGRYDCMVGTVVCPKEANTTERMQWDYGWSHELKGIPRPYDD